MMYNKYKIKIKEHLEKIKSNKINFLDDYIAYNFCGICKKESNIYFCENCQKNICEHCYKNCNGTKHDLINLSDFRKDNYSKIQKIKDTLKTYIIPIKNNNESFDKGDLILVDEEEKNIMDLLLINKIIWVDYNNYFHYKNIDNILNYIVNIYSIYYVRKYEEYGKYIDENGDFYIGQFKNNLKYEKEKIKDKNGYIINEIDYIEVKKEGNGKLVYKNGDYYIGQFKNDLNHGKGKLYDKNGNIFYEGDFYEDKIEGFGKLSNL